MTVVASTVFKLLTTSPIAWSRSASVAVSEAVWSRMSLMVAPCPWNTVMIEEAMLLTLSGLSAPKIPQQQRISSHDVIDVGSVTTEFNTLFETITSIAEKVDPIELSATYLLPNRVAASISATTLTGIRLM